MATSDKIFKIPPEEIGNGNYVHFIEIESISDELEVLINSKIVLITEGNSTTTVDQAKKRLNDFLNGKKGSSIEKGTVAEFIIHLYLNQIGFTQECMFYNLEERSIKKGFDGYYSINKEEWILESKSGSISTTSISHPRKINEAYNDLTLKVKDEEGNNPWRNAYHHASHIDVNSADDLRKNLKKLADNFDEGIYKEIENLNIIPASTIFLEDRWESLDVSALKSEIESNFSSKKYKCFNILVVNKKSIELLQEFLNKNAD